MVRNVIAEARKRKIDYIIAPYEADIQLTYLVNSGIADVAITEDSDLIVLGCKKIIFKMKLDSTTVDEAHLNTILKKSDFKTLRQLQITAIFAGCDYMPGGVPRCGLKTTVKYLHDVDKNNDEDLTLDTVFSHPKLREKRQEWLSGCLRALFTFQFQVIFDPKIGVRRYYKEMHEEIKSNNQLLRYFGNLNDENPRYNFEFAIGNVDYSTGEEVTESKKFSADKLPKFFSKNIPKNSSLSPIRKKVSNIVVENTQIKRPRNSKFFESGSSGSSMMEPPVEKKIKESVSLRKSPAKSPVRFAAKDIVNELVIDESSNHDLISEDEDNAHFYSPASTATQSKTSNSMEFISKKFLMLLPEF